MTIYFDKFDNDLASTSVPCGVVEMSHRPGIYRNFFKRIFDFLSIVVSAPIVAPIVGILALIVARDGHAPFYWSTRVGRNGKEFSMLKLRTMVPNAEKLLEQHLAENPAAKAEWDATQKLKNDPRITRIGSLLRKTSLDELPQLWNVLVGDMSLVGPRPMLPAQRALYSGLSYYALRPGITGPWQVSDRNSCEFSRRAVHDQKYDEHVSFFSDLGYVFKTFAVVIKGTGF